MINLPFKNLRVLIIKVINEKDIYISLEQTLLLGLHTNKYKISLVIIMNLKMSNSLSMFIFLVYVLEILSLQCQVFLSSKITYTKCN